MITAFRGEHAFLSNFHPAPVRLDGRVYSSVEHAYQAAKTLDPDKRWLIAQAHKPGQAKRMGRQLALRPGWEQVKRTVMLDLLRSKFQPGSYLAQRLLATWPQVLLEGNTWGGHDWGMVYEDPSYMDGILYPGGWHGMNWLGRLLMQVRAERLYE